MQHLCCGRKDKGAADVRLPKWYRSVRLPKWYRSVRSGELEREKQSMISGFGLLDLRKGVLGRELTLDAVGIVTRKPLVLLLDKTDLRIEYGQFLHA